MDTYKLDLVKLDHIFPGAYFSLAVGCAEPGYDDKPVITADWNNVPQVVFDRLEALGFSCEWLDEWVMCDQCGRAFRSSPDSYHWQMSGIIDDMGCLCLDCIDPESYFEGLENNPRAAITWPIFERYNPSNYGYVLAQDKFENGFYEGQTDDPAKILAYYQDHCPGRYLFAMTDQGQFDIEFSLYKKVEA